MAENRESFPNLDNGAGVGSVLRQVVEGDSVAAKNGQLAFGFKDAAGNAIAAPVSTSGTAAGNAVPTLPGKDLAGNLIEIPVRVSGNSGTTPAVAVLAGQDTAGDLRSLPIQNPGDAQVNGQPVLPGVDSAGTVQMINERLEGEAIAGVAALPVLGAKDPSDQFAYLKTNASGELLVSSDAAGSNLKARGTNAGNVALTAIATITLVASKIYEGIEVNASCLKENYFKLSWNDNGVDNILAEGRTGPGQYNWVAVFDRMGFTSGATGTQQLIVYGQNLTGGTNTMTANVAVTQLN